MNTSWYATRIYFANPNLPEMVEDLHYQGADMEENHGPVSVKDPLFLPFLYQIEIGTGDGHDLDIYVRKQGYRAGPEAYANVMTDLARKLPKTDLPEMYYNYLDQEVRSKRYLKHFLGIDPTSEVVKKLTTYKSGIDYQITREYGKEMISTIVQTIPDLPVFLDAFAIRDMMNDKEWRVFYNILSYITADDDILPEFPTTEYDDLIDTFLSKVEAFKSEN